MQSYKFLKCPQHNKGDKHMGKRKSKKDMVSPVIFLIAIVMLAIAITGVFLDWISTTTKVLVETTTTATLSDLFELNEKAEIDNFAMMASFALITVAAGGLATLLFGCSLVIRLKLIRLVALLLGVIAVLAAIATIITAFTFCDSYSASVIDDVIESKSSPAIGAWLTAIGGLLCGVSCTLGAARN